MIIISHEFCTIKSPFYTYNHIVKENNHFISNIRFYRQFSSKKLNTRNQLVSPISYTLFDALFHPHLQDVVDSSAFAGIEHDISSQSVLSARLIRQCHHN